MKGFFDKKFKNKYDRICFLCAEETAERCHRRLVAEYMMDNDVEVIHL